MHPKELRDKEKNMFKTNRVFITYGDENEDFDHYSQLEDLASNGESSSWTVDPKVKIGDGIIFYIKSPTQAFVAMGIVESEVSRKMPVLGSWGRGFSAVIGSITMFKEPLERKPLIPKFPEWGWLRFPIRCSQVPEVSVAKLKKLIKI